MNKPSPPDRISRGIDEHRTGSLHRLDTASPTAIGKTLAGCSPRPSRLVVELAKMLARDLTAVGLLSHGQTDDPAQGGIWLAISPESAGIVITWAQHHASVAVLGCDIHDEIQRQMRLNLHEILKTLGYRCTSYGAGDAFVVTRSRPPLGP